MKLAEKYLPVYQSALDRFVKDRPNWRTEVLAQLIHWALDNLRHYVEDVHDPEINWARPLLKLPYEVEWNWAEPDSSDLASGGHIYGHLTRQNTAGKRRAVRTLTNMMVNHTSAEVLAAVTNWACYHKRGTSCTPVFPVPYANALNSITSKRERRECFEQMVRPFTFGTTVEDVPDFRFNGNINGRKFGMGLIFEIHPLIADYDQKQAYHPIVVGLSMLPEMEGDTPASWPVSDRLEFWKALLGGVLKFPERFA